jgi:hypothetical protein
MLILDVTKTVGFFALTGLVFNLTTIAALLTLIGYSARLSSLTGCARTFALRRGSTFASS